MARRRTARPERSPPEGCWVEGRPLTEFRRSVTKRQPSHQQKLVKQQMLHLLLVEATATAADA